METVLIVTPDGGERASMLAQFPQAQFDVASASDLASGLARIDLVAPDLLITVVHESDFDGQPLVEAGWSRNPRMAALVLHDSPDAARNCAAVSLPSTAVRHVDRTDGLKVLLRLAADTLSLRERRRWSRTLLPAPMSVCLLPGRARLLNVSYGGIQLEVSAPFGLSLPSLFKLELPSVGSLNALRIWSRAAGSSGTVSCGAEVSPASLRRVLRWRRMVDALRKAGSALVF